MKEKDIRTPFFAVVGYGGYPFDVLVAVGATPKQVAAKLKRLGATSWSESDVTYGGAGNTTFSKEDHRTVVQLRRFDHSPYWHGVLAHEVAHAVCFLMERVGIKMTDESEEAYTYAIQDITSKILKALQSA